MTLPKTRPKHMLRYSPRPIEDYGRVLLGKPYGPAQSKLLDTPDAWNLAYLSHDYVEAFQHKDPMFTTHVRRTLQTRLDGGGLGIGLDPTTLVGSLLSLPAPRFVYLLRTRPELTVSLPLFTAYGPAWVRTIVNRERLCETGWQPDRWNAAQESDALEPTLTLLAKLRGPPGPSKWLDLSGIL